MLAVTGSRREEGKTEVREKTDGAVKSALVTGGFISTFCDAVHWCRSGLRVEFPVHGHYLEYETQQ